MQKRIKHKFGYAIVKKGETAKEAVIRSLSRHYGGDLWICREDSWTQNSKGRVKSQTFQLTFVGKRDKYGGYPVLGECFITLDCEAASCLDC